MRSPGYARSGFLEVMGIRQHGLFMATIRALFLISDLGIGGSERKSVRIANALRKGGHDIHLAYFNAPHTLRGSLAPALPVLYLERTGKFCWSALRRLKHYLVEQGISCVACVNLYPLLYELGRAHVRTPRTV